MKLPAKLTLGNKPKKPNLVLGGTPAQAERTTPAEDAPKYSSGQIKLLMIAIEDLHKNRFRNGWFTLLKFTDKVLEKPALMEELKTFSAENDIEPDEWTEPVIIFDKQAQAETAQAQGQKKNKFKPRLQIGVEDEDKSPPACAMPQQQQQPASKPSPLQAPPQQPKPQQHSQKQSLAKKPPGLTLGISGNNSDKPPPHSRLQLQIGANHNRDTTASKEQYDQPSQSPVKPKRLQKAIEFAEGVALRRQKARLKQAFQKLGGPKAKAMGAAKLATIFQDSQRHSLAAGFAAIETLSVEAKTEDILQLLDQNLQHVASLVKQLFPQQSGVSGAKGHSPYPMHSQQLNKINLLCVQSLQEKLDRVSSLYAEFLEKRDAQDRDPVEVQRIYLDHWEDHRVLQQKVRSTVKLISMLNRYAFADKRVLRLVKIWQRRRLDDEMHLLEHELTKIANQHKAITLVLLNQTFQARLQSVFYTWLQNCSSKQIILSSTNFNPAVANLTISQHSAGLQSSKQTLFLRSTNLGRQNIQTFFFSPAKMQNTTQKMTVKGSQTSNGAPLIQFPQSTGSVGALPLSNHQQMKQLKQQVEKQKRLAAEKSSKRSGSLSHSNNERARSLSKKRGQAHTPKKGQRNAHSKTQRQPSILKGRNKPQSHDQSSFMEEESGSQLNALNMDSSGGQKSTTHQHQREGSQLKLLNTDSQAKDQIPPPMHSQQYKSSNTKMDMMRENLQIQARKMNLSDISESTHNVQLSINSTGPHHLMTKSAVQPFLFQIGANTATAGEAGSWAAGPTVLMIPEAQTKAALTLARYLVFKGKQKLELQECLDYLKHLQLRKNLYYKQTGILKMSPMEDENFTYNHLKVKAIVLGQWKLFAYYHTRVLAHRNITLTRFFSKLQNALFRSKLLAVHQIRSYQFYLLTNLQRKAAKKTRLNPQQRYIRLAQGLPQVERIARGGHTRTLYRSLLKWFTQASYLANKEEILMEQQYQAEREARKGKGNTDLSAQAVQKIKNQGLRLGMMKLRSIYELPRSFKSSKKALLQLAVAFAKWRSRALRRNSNGRVLLKRIIQAKLRKVKLRPFLKWLSAINPSGAKQKSNGVSSMIEALDEALIKNHSIVAASMATSFTKKNQLLSDNARDRLISRILKRQILAKQPALKQLNKAVRKWQTLTKAMQQLDRSTYATLKPGSSSRNLSIKLQALQEQIEVITQEKQELESKVEEQSELNEQMQGEISQMFTQTDCNDCKQKQLRITLLRTQSSQKRIGHGLRQDTDGVVSECWDLESSQASAQLENIGRLATENEYDFQNASSSGLNLDSQGLIIQDPLARGGKQLSHVSGGQDGSDDLANVGSRIDGESGSFLGSQDAADFGEVHASAQLINIKQMSELSNRRQTEKSSSHKKRKTMNENQTITSGDEDAPNSVRRYSELVIDGQKMSEASLQRKNTEHSGVSTKRMSLSSAGVVKRLQTADALSQMPDPQRLETTNEELKQELEFVQAEVSKKYEEMEEEERQLAERIEALKKKKQMLIERQRVRPLTLAV